MVRFGRLEPLLPARDYGLNNQRIARCAFPNDHDPPSLLQQRALVPPIAFTVAAKLCSPERRVGGRKFLKPAIPMGVPETPMHKDGDLVLRKHEIRRTGQRSTLESVAKSRREQQASNKHLRHGIARPDSRHHSTSDASAYDVRHERIPTWEPLRANRSRDRNFPLEPATHPICLFQLGLGCIVPAIASVFPSRA